MVKSIRPDVLEKIVAGIPVRRLGEPEEIGSMVVVAGIGGIGLRDRGRFLAQRRPAHGVRRLQAARHKAVRAARPALERTCDWMPVRRHRLRTGGLRRFQSRGVSAQFEFVV